MARNTLWHTGARSFYLENNNTPQLKRSVLPLSLELMHSGCTYLDNHSALKPTIDHLHGWRDSSTRTIDLLEPCTPTLSVYSSTQSWTSQWQCRCFVSRNKLVSLLLEKGEGMWRIGLSNFVLIDCPCLSSVIYDYVM